MRIRKVSPSLSSADALRNIADVLNRLVDLTQPFSISPVQTGTFTASEIYGFYPCDASASAMTAYLPPASAHKSKKYAFKKIDSSANAVTIDGSGSETVDGDTTRVIGAQYDCITVISDGSNWWIE